MVLKQIIYFHKGKKKNLEVKICKSFWSKFTGLMFKKNSSPLLFVFNKNKKISIHSLFCNPFKAIWLDDKMNVTKIIRTNKWKLNIFGNGKFLLEIPLTYKQKSRRK